MLLTKEWQNVSLYEWTHSSGAKCTFYVDAKLSSDQSIVENKSLVDIRLRSVLGAYSSLSGSGYKFTCTNCPTVEGAGIWYFGTETITAVSNKEIKHEDDGTKQLPITATLYNGYLGLNKTMSATVQLPTIARKSSISCASPFNIGDNVTLNINSKSASFKHTIRYNFENVGERIIAQNITGGTNIQYPWATPATMFTDGNMENKPNGNGYLTVETFANGTSIGISDKFPFTANVPNNPPDITASIIDSNNNIVQNYTGNNSILVKGLSNAQITATVTPKNSASISNYKIMCSDGKSTSSYPVATLNGIGSGTFNITATDTRGFTKTITRTNTFKDYFAPYAIETNIRRTEQTSKEIIATLSGKWWNNNFGIKQNTLKYSYRTRVSGGTWSSWSADASPVISGNNFTITDLKLGSDYDTAKAYDIQFRLKDDVNYYPLNSQQVTVSIPILEIYDDEIAIYGNGYIQNELIVGNIKEKNFFDDRYWDFKNHEAKMTTNTYFNTFMIVKNNFLDKFEVGKTYTVSFECTETDGEYWFTCVRYYTDNTYEENYDTYGVGKYSYTFTVNKELLYIDLRFNRTANIGTTKNSTIKNIQIEEGGGDTDFTPAISKGYISGSNSNGEWVKYDDGRMICRNIFNIPNCPITSNWGNAYVYDYTFPNGFPQTFIDIPQVLVVSGGNDKNWAVIVYQNGTPTKTTGGGCGIMRMDAQTFTNQKVGYIAIGRWK